MIFPYVATRIEPSPLSDGELIYRPLVRLQLIGLREMAVTWALVDTGADDTLLPLSIADELGVTLSRETTTIQGYGGQSVPVTAGEIDLIISDGNETFQWTAMVGFADLADPENEMIILGHRAGLEFFRATFDGEQRRVEMSPTDRFPGVVES